MKKTFVYLAIFSLCIIPYYNNTFAASPHQEWLSTMKTIIDWETPEPTTASRFYATIFTAMYDAWSTFWKKFWCCLYFRYLGKYMMRKYIRK